MNLSQMRRFFTHDEKNWVLVGLTVTSKSTAPQVACQITHIGSFYAWVVSPFVDIPGQQSLGHKAGAKFMGK